MPVDDVTDDNQEQPQLPVLGGANITNGNDDEGEQDIFYVNNEDEGAQEGTPARRRQRSARSAR